LKLADYTVKLSMLDPEDGGCTLVRNDVKYLEVEIGLGERILV